MNEEEMSILAFLQLRGTPRLSSRNVDCFMQGYKACNDVLVHNFDKFLEREGRYYQSEYIESRKESCAYSGQPITRKHQEEFAAAEQLGSLLLKAAELIKKHNILN